jgi:aspartate/methionine/tyrosine aminotransferase
MDGMDIAITAGANQAFMNAALAVCDNDDTAILLAPYYFSHKLSLQLCGARVSVCPFDTATLAPDFQALESMMAAQRPRLVSGVLVTGQCF